MGPCYRRCTRQHRRERRSKAARSIHCAISGSLIESGSYHALQKPQATNTPQCQAPGLQPAQGQRRQAPDSGKGARIFESSNRLELTMPNEVENTVDAILSQAGITYAANYAGERIRDNWQCDAWRCSLSHNGKAETFEFFTGLGLRKKYKPGLYLASQYPKGSPQKPRAASLLHSIMLDARLASESFEDFCANVGYSTDSRKALAIYLQCQEQGRKLRSIIPPTVCAELETALQDY